MPPAVVAAVLTSGVLLIGITVWVLGPGAEWVLHHLDGVSDKSMSAKDKADALDAIRGRVITIATGILAIIVVYYTATNAHIARRAQRPNPPTFIQEHGRWKSPGLPGLHPQRQAIHRQRHERASACSSLHSDGPICDAHHYPH